MSFVTVDDFDESKLVLGNLYHGKKPVHYHKLYIKYKYPDGKVGDLFLKTPELKSTGIWINGNGKKITHSVGISCDEERDEKFVSAIETIADFAIKKSKTAKIDPDVQRTPIDADGLVVLKQSRAKEDLVMYPKLETKNGKTTADFRGGRGREIVDPSNYEKKPFLLKKGMLNFRNVYIGRDVLSLQIFLTQALVEPLYDDDDEEPDRFWKDEEPSIFSEDEKEETKTEKKKKKHARRD